MSAARTIENEPQTFPAGKRNDAIRYADLLKCKACKLSSGFNGSPRRRGGRVAPSAVGEVYRDPCFQRKEWNTGVEERVNHTSAKIDADDIQDCTIVA